MHGHRVLAKCVVAAPLPFRWPAQGPLHAVHCRTLVRRCVPLVPACSLVHTEYVWTCYGEGKWCVGTREVVACRLLAWRPAHVRRLQRMLACCAGQCRMPGQAGAHIQIHAAHMARTCSCAAHACSACMQRVHVRTLLMFHTSSSKSSTSSFGGQRQGGAMRATRPTAQHAHHPHVTALLSPACGTKSPQHSTHSPRTPKRRRAEKDRPQDADYNRIILRQEASFNTRTPQPSSWPPSGGRARNRRGGGCGAAAAASAAERASLPTPHHH